MQIQAIIDTVIKLSQRDELADDLPTVLYYINKVKLKFLRERRFRFNQQSTLLQLKANKRTVDVPSDFLHSPVIRRNRVNVTVNDPVFGNISKLQFLTKFVDKSAFEESYPERNESNTLLVGTPNAFIFWGTSIYFGLIPQVDEQVYLDYYSRMKDYHTVDNKEDILSIQGYDFLINAAIEEIFTSWIISPAQKALWAGEKRDSLLSLKKLQVFEEAGFGYDADMEEPG